MDDGFYGADLIEEMNYQAARQIRFANLIEQMPLFESYVTPAWDKLDPIGIPRPQIDYRLEELTALAMARAREVSEQVFNALGVSEIHHSGTFFGAGHVIGTYRMGSDPKTSWWMRCSDLTITPTCSCWAAGRSPQLGPPTPP